MSKHLSGNRSRIQVACVRTTAAAAALLSSAALFAVVSEGTATARVPCPTQVNVDTPQELVTEALLTTCTRAQYAALFAGAEKGAPPTNIMMDGQARPVSGPDLQFSAAIGEFWSGKHFRQRWLLNRIVDGEAGRADVYAAKSVIDGRPVTRLDYRRSGMPGVHDEIRQLPNGICIGYGFYDNRPIVAFWLQPAVV